MSDKDYRNTPYCDYLQNVTDKKADLKKRILIEHSHTKNFYNSIQKRSSEYNRAFAEIYNKKCAYCGVSSKVIPISLFEIDHYICESSFEKKIEAGQIENLVYACQDCNRSKRAYKIPATHVSSLNPDDSKVATIFERDESYRIVVSERYRNDVIVGEYYDKLKLGFDLRRLDFLLMNMIGLYDSIKNEPEAGVMLEAIELLRKKRNSSVLA